MFYNIMEGKVRINESMCLHIFITFAVFPSRRAFFIRNGRMGGNVYMRFKFAAIILPFFRRHSSLVSTITCSQDVSQVRIAEGNGILAEAFLNVCIFISGKDSVKF